MRTFIVLVIAVASLVLTLLALVAGNTPNFMEDFHIISFNTSGMGQNLIPTHVGGGDDDDSSPTSCGHLGGVLGKVCASATAKVGDVINSGIADLSEFENDVAGKLAQKLGISQWYSVHVMNICEGTFTPNATTAGARYNVTSCTAPLQTVSLNISSLLDHELGVGPLHLNLADLGFTEDLQSHLDKIPGLLRALVALYILAVACSGLLFVFSIVRILARPPYTLLASLTNTAAALIAAFGLFVGNTIIAVSANPVADRINEDGQRVGLSASIGEKFAIVTWFAFVLLVVAAVQCVKESRQDITAQIAVLRQKRHYGRF